MALLALSLRRTDTDGPRAVVVVGDKIMSGRLVEFAALLGVFIVSVKKIGVTIAGAAAFAALGIGSGVANADKSLPSSPGMTKLDKPHWDDDWDDWDRDRRGPGWNGPGYGYGYGGGYGGPCVWVPPAVSMWVPPAVC
jgi:hypothetical protein